MAWVQVGPHKINTVQICYVEQSGETVRIRFHGQWEGNPLELQGEDAKSFWKHLKAEDATAGRDKGSATVLPRMRSAVTLDVGNHGPDKPKPAAAPTTSSSGQSGYSPSHPLRTPEASKAGEPRRH